MEVPRLAAATGVKKARTIAICRRPTSGVLARQPMRGANKPCSAICGPELRKSAGFATRSKGVFAFRCLSPWLDRMRQRLSHHIWLFSERKPQKVRHKRGVFFQNQHRFCQRREGQGRRRNASHPLHPFLTRRGASGGAPRPRSIGVQDHIRFSSRSRTGPGTGRNIIRTNVPVKRLPASHVHELPQVPGAPASRRLLPTDPPGRRSRIWAVAMAVLRGGGEDAAVITMSLNCRIDLASRLPCRTHGRALLEKGL